MPSILDKFLSFFLQNELFSVHGSRFGRSGTTYYNIYITLWAKKIEKEVGKIPQLVFQCLSRLIR